jgi:prepilin-type N-terminal cleavage/methylation domain-containing protein
MRRKKLTGFSLIEVVLGMALFAMLMVTVNMVLLDGFKAARRTEALNRVKADGAVVLDKISKEIEFSSGIDNCAVTTSSDTLTLTRPDDAGTEVTYALSGTTVVMTTVAGGTAAISSSGVIFSHYTPDCPTMFVCTPRAVTICFGADVASGADVSDTASNSGGLKFYNTVVRKNNL